MSTPPHLSLVERRALLGAAGIGALAAMSKAGPLNPPAGSVASTGHTIDDVYNRISAPPAVGGYDGRIPLAGGSSPIELNGRGSYVLTAPLSVSSSAPALTISGGNVTLDLNGQCVQNNLSNLGILVGPSCRNIVIRNGMLSSCSFGVSVADTAWGVLLEDMVFFSPHRGAVSTAGKSVRVRRCMPFEFGASFPPDGVAYTGILCTGSMTTIEDCVVSQFNDSGYPVSPDLVHGIRVSGSANVVERCTVMNETNLGGNGITMSGSGTYRNNCVINFTTKYNINGAADGGGNA